eukprot:gene16195-22029_t
MGPSDVVRGPFSCRIRTSHPRHDETLPIIHQDRPLFCWAALLSGVSNAGTGTNSLPRRSCYYPTYKELGLQRYLTEIRKFPMLHKDEEYMLAKRWREHEDTGAAEKLVTSHLRLVAKMAMGYRGYGLPVAEVISEGNIGLMQAVKKFDPEKGFRLATYAMWWIRASIQEYVLRSWSLVKMGTTAAQKKLFFNLRRMKSKMQAIEEGDLKPEDVNYIATQLAVTNDEVISMNRRLSGPDASLNVRVGEDGGGEWQDWLASDDESAETEYAEREEHDE